MANSVEMNSKLIEVPKCATPQPFEHISDPDVTNSKCKCQRYYNFQYMLLIKFLILDSFLSPVELFPRTPESLPGCSKSCSTSDIPSRPSSSCSTTCSGMLYHLSPKLKKCLPIN